MTKGLYTKQYYLNSRNFQLDKDRAIKTANSILKYKPKRVLDVGCGLGTLTTYLRSLGIDAHGLDFADTLKKDFSLGDCFHIANAKNMPFENNSFDLVISTDFFEHLTENEIDVVLSEMKRVGKIVIAKIAYEAPLNLRQMKLHQTNKNESWWKNKLKGVIII